MTPRNVYTGLFVALCLTLNGLILGRQMAAHPAPPPDAADGRNAQGCGGGRFWDRRQFHVADSSTRRAVLGSIHGELDALRRGDADRAVSYQSRELRREFTRPADFLSMVAARDPEFAHSKSASFSLVWADGDGDRAGVRVTVTGKDGHSAQHFYRMVREGGVYRVAGVW